ncbi:cryptochrome/photolyase family protein [Celeribacter sp. PS-C1]|uniref:cryptochrome/photolyase family protein n=1 Tax=Celeribacter sp. PS-C1 TaxID=2820813 RepID=UPI0021054F5C|nr:cryptochrome/photolyase family protein [Celeribacter sp. PS-C1]
MVSRVILILGDQLSSEMSSLKEGDKARDLVVMAEVAAETDYVAHHPKKIALIFAAMRHFAEELRAAGWQVAYTKLDDEDNTQSLLGEARRRAQGHGADEIVMTEAGEWRLRLEAEESAIPVRQLPDTRFIATEQEFADWAEGRKALRMEYFYREMRRKTGLLMDGDAPSGGQWNFDHDNRKPASDDLFRIKPLTFKPDEITRKVLDLVEAKFGENFGELRPFSYAVTRKDAECAQQHFLDHHLQDFGTYQDAMLSNDRVLHHSLLSAYLNIGLLDPLELCRAVEQRYRDGKVPINSAEGFIRQILGWREYVRGLYFLKGPDYPHQNKLNHQRGLPALYWGAETRMNCLSHAVAQTREDAYAHHIQRLMVTGNFALLAGVNPKEVHEWYLAVYIDAFEWVEAPNTVGMSQFADGGVIASKPYISSGNYIHKMSDYCGDCAYAVTKKTGEGACPFNLLYWHFLDRHRERFKGNPRMGQMYRTWDRMDEDKRQTIRKEAAAFLDRLSNGETV